MKPSARFCPLSERTLSPLERQDRKGRKCCRRWYLSTLSHILQLGERTCPVSTASIAVRERSRHGNRGDATPVFVSGARCPPGALAEEGQRGWVTPPSLSFCRQAKALSSSRLSELLRPKHNMEWPGPKRGLGIACRCD